MKTIAILLVNETESFVLEIPSEEINHHATFCCPEPTVSTLYNWATGGKVLARGDHNVLAWLEKRDAKKSTQLVTVRGAYKFYSKARDMASLLVYYKNRFLDEEKDQ